MHSSKRAWIIVSGIIWLVIGIGLLRLGFNFIILKAQTELSDSSSLIAKLAPLAGSREHASLTLIAIGLILGFLKGRFFLIKAAKKVVDRILSLNPPIKITQVYSKKYLILVAVMVLLGFSMKWLGIPNEIRGAIDVAIGSALINGSMAYFRLAFSRKKEIEQI